MSSTIDAPAGARDVSPRAVLAARNGVAAVFALNGLAVATWFARVPAIRESLGLSAGRLGLLLLAMSAGALVAMSTAGLVTLRLGPARTVASSTVLVALGLTAAGLSASLAGSLIGVVVGLFAVGYGSGTCDVAMNVEGAAVEKRLGRTIMPRFHAAWSLGSVAGAGLGAGAARLGVPVGWHLPVIAVLVLAGTLLGVRAFLAAPAEPAGAAEPADHRRALLATWREPRTLLIGLFVLVMAFTEGSANDWLAVAFVDGYGVSEAAGAAVFGVFVVGMTLGRTAGTVAIDRWGRVPVLFGTIALAVTGATCAVLAGSGPLAVVGVALWGVGASLGFPVGMSAAADDEDRAPTRVSVVAMIGYTAFLAGPPLLGFLGDHLGILHALGLVPLLLLPTLALVPILRPPAR
ncbi:MFS transporter [Micromonospora terminaliae]|uniref:MFS transporter n=1 Tax=Micromonospora terminaliae TaxID=1914461 RepID=A0AAJ2ZD59_9ACTN|nr:MFS transporter [Micromonospora terminaliae]NES27266.1 MFS transporter [Micromonospora terminaliae]QGL47983.1 MFS transporter [Micromonospora terminaliae]